MYDSQQTIARLPDAVDIGLDARRCRPVSALAPALSFELVETRTRFEALAPEWNRLHALARRNQLAFQSHKWLSLWADASAPDQAAGKLRLAIVVARRGASACLICPFAIEREFGLSRLVWMGEPASQYGDVLLDPAEASSTEIAAALDVVLARTRPDIIHLRRVRADAAIAPALKAARATIATGSVAPFMDFRSAATWDAYALRFAAKARKNRRRLRRRLDEKGTVDIAVLPPGPAAAEAIRLGLAFKHEWLARRGELYSALREPALADLLCRAAAARDEAFAPFVSVMSCAGDVISIQFGLVTARGLALYLIAYAPAWEKAGVGVLHIEATAAHCVENAIPTLDFLGPDAPYKREWSDGAMAVDDYVLAATWSGQVFTKAVLRHARDRLKAMLSSLPHQARVAIARQLHRRAGRMPGAGAGK